MRRRGVARLILFQARRGALFWAAPGVSRRPRAAAVRGVAARRVSARVNRRWQIAYRSPAERLVASQALLHVYRQYGQRPAITSATARKRERPAFW